MAFKMSVTMDNAAFESPEELPEIIRRVADRVADGETAGSVRDSNGNTVGTWRVGR